MLTYEKCLELKKAGYPQDARGGGHFTAEGGKLIGDRYPTQESDVYIPTLEELIEACPGIILYQLEEASRLWVAGLEHYDGLCATEKYIDASIGMKGTGISPVEAVANLYILLHSKP